MQAEIGSTAGTIWHALSEKDELSLAQLKKIVNGMTPIFEWAVGWLAREDKIVITRAKRSYSLRLKQTEA